MKDTSKQRVNLTIPVFLLEEARKSGLNLSQSAQAGIAMALKKTKEEQWLKDHAQAIAAYNAHIDEDGLAFKPIWETQE